MKNEFSCHGDWVSPLWASFHYQIQSAAKLQLFPSDKSVTSAVHSDPGVKSAFALVLKLYAPQLFVT